MNAKNLQQTNETFLRTLREAKKIFGAKSVAYDLGVTNAVVRMWAAGRHLPKLPTQVGAIYILQNPNDPIRLYNTASAPPAIEISLVNTNKQPK